MITIISLRREELRPYLLVTFAESPLVVARFFNQQAPATVHMYGSGIVIHEDAFRRLFKLKLKGLP